MPWNCHIDSETDAYYKTLYLGLIILYCMVVVVYIIASVIINTMVAFAVSKVKRIIIMKMDIRNKYKFKNRV